MTDVIELMARALFYNDDLGDFEDWENEVLYDKKRTRIGGLTYTYKRTAKAALQALADAPLDGDVLAQVTDKWNSAHPSGLWLSPRQISEITNLVFTAFIQMEKTNDKR